MLQGRAESSWQVPRMSVWLNKSEERPAKHLPAYVHQTLPGFREKPWINHSPSSCLWSLSCTFSARGRTFYDMPTPSSAVVASGALDKPHGMRENTGWCGTKTNPEHTSPLPNPLIPFRATSSKRKNVGCWLVQKPVVFRSVLSL